MSNLCVVKVRGTGMGTPTPHDGRYIVQWNPHTEFGTCEVTTTRNLAMARKFTHEQAFEEWKTVSRVQPVRPDGKPNRPLSGLTIEIVKLP